MRTLSSGGSTLDVVIAGAGPTGLTAALGLARAGVRVAVCEAEPELVHDLRAGTFHPPTLEMLRPLIGEQLVAAGIKVPRWQIRDRSEGVIAEFDLGLLVHDTPYPYRLHAEQHKLTPILARELERLGVAIAFSARFERCDQDGDGVTSTFVGPAGAFTVRSRYLVGADGGRSAVRKDLGIAFEGFTWPERFLVASTTFDLASIGFTGNAYIADPQEWVAIFRQPHLGPPGLWRIVFPCAPELSEETILSEAFVQERLGGFLPPGRAYDVPYRSIYRVHQRVAKDFRRGRVLLAGDAAHVNNPLGGMGLNTGIHDAVNLTAKLVAVVRDGADDALLDRYVRQRRRTNIEYVQAQSIRNKRLLEERDPAVRAQRFAELRGIATDPEKAYQHLLATSMIASVRSAEAIA